MGMGNQPIQVDPPHIVGRQDDGVMGRELLDIVCRAASQSVYLIQRLDAAIPKHLDKLHKNLSRTGGIIHGPVVILQRYIKRLGYRIQLKTVQRRQQHPRHSHRIYDGIITGKLKPLTVLADKAHVKACVVSHHDSTLTEGHKLRQHRLDSRSINYHLILDMREILDLKGNRHSWIYKRGKTIYDLFVCHLHRTDLDDLIVDR